MSDRHVRQFTGSPCGPFNCAAASGAMAIEYAGGPALTADQVRAESRVSCKPGVDTVSGGLRILDVQRVANAHGVTIDYGGLQSWPAEDLLTRLERGMGAIVLGDAARAPISPTPGVLYHSVFIHGLDAQGRTHWHDPRLSAASWVPLAKVLTYWGVVDGYRYAGFVPPAPPDTSTEDPMACPLILETLFGYAATIGGPTASRRPTTVHVSPSFGAAVIRTVGDAGEAWTGIVGWAQGDANPADLGDTRWLEHVTGSGVREFVPHGDVPMLAPVAATTATLGTETSADGRSVLVTLKGG